jgi:hypothetical protein
MSTNQSHLRSVTTGDGDGAGDSGRQQARQRAAKGLPTDRIKRDRQYEIPAAIGRLSGARKEPINAERLARAIGGGIAPTTVILSNRWFEDAGWITVPAKGQYAATDALWEYTCRLATDTPARAVLALHGPVRRSWFWQVLESHLIDGKLRVSDAENMLMDAAEANPGHLPMIRNLIAWLEHIGMIAVDDQFIAVKADASGPAAEDGRERAPERAEKPAETGTEGAEPTAQAGDRSPAPVISLSFEVKITVDDLARLTADQITALFAAVGTVAAVKGRQ